jgi:hypothetical protein
MVVAEQLDLNMFRLVKEALDEDGAITKRRFGLRSGPLEVFFQIIFLAHDTHAATTSAEGCFDDDWESVLVGWPFS